MRSDHAHELGELIEEFSSGEGCHRTAVPHLSFYRTLTGDLATPVVYQPSVCIIVQGEKEVMLEGEIYRYAAGDYLAVSVDLPTVGRVTQASPEQPYLCIQIDLDPVQLSALLTQRGLRVEAASSTRRALFVGGVTEELVDSVLRLTRLLKAPQDISCLAPLVVQEIYYRLITGPHGAAIAQLAIAGSNMHRIAQAIEKIKTGFAATLRVEELAQLANMSPSSFHHHFKEVTAMSPLQYQKRLRLLEARRLMLSEQTSAAQAAYRVGYESSSQFSREYARMFGVPPARDVGRMRAA